MLFFEQQISKASTTLYATKYFYVMTNKFLLPSCTKELQVSSLV